MILDNYPLTPEMVTRLKSDLERSSRNLVATNGVRADDAVVDRITLRLILLIFDRHLTVVRLARITGFGDGAQSLTVFAEDGEMVAFKYDHGGYGWANRSSFVPEAEAERRIAELRERRERERTDETFRRKVRLQKEIASAQEELDRLTGWLEDLEAEESRDVECRA